MSQRGAAQYPTRRPAGKSCDKVEMIRLPMVPARAARLLNVLRTIRFSRFKTSRILLSCISQNSMYASSRTTNTGSSRSSARSAGFITVPSGLFGEVKNKPLRDVPKQRFWLQLRQYQSLARHFLGYRPPFHLHVVYISKCRMPDKKYAPFTRQSKEYMPKVGGVFRTTSSGSSTTRKIKSISLKGQELSVEGCIDAPGSPRLHHTPLIYSLLVFHIPRPVKLD